MQFQTWMMWMMMNTLNDAFVRYPDFMMLCHTEVIAGCPAGHKNNTRRLLERLIDFNDSMACSGKFPSNHSKHKSWLDWPVMGGAKIVIGISEYRTESADTWTLTWDPLHEIQLKHLKLVVFPNVFSASSTFWRGETWWGIRKSDRTLQVGRGKSPVRRLSQFQHVKCFQVSTHLTNQSTHTFSTETKRHTDQRVQLESHFRRDPKSKRIVGTWGRSVTFHPEHRGLNRINSNWFRHLQNQYLILIWKGLFSIPKKSIKSIRNSMKKRAIINTKKINTKSIP